MSSKKILEDLFDFGMTKKNVEIIEGKFSVEFKNISVNSQLVLEKGLEDMKEDSARYAMQKYAIKLLSLTLIRWGDKKFNSSEEWEIFLDSQSISMIDRVVKEQQNFEKEIKKALKLEEIEENFSQTDAPQEESKQSPKASIREKEKALEKQ